MDTGLKRPLKLYLDTSIPNFVFAGDDKEKQEITKTLFQKVSQREYEFYISGVVIRELEKAPPSKRHELLEIVKGLETLEITEEVEG